MWWIYTRCSSEPGFYQSINWTIDSNFNFIQWLITYSDEPLASDTGTVKQQILSVYVAKGTKHEEILTSIEEQLNRRYGTGYWKIERQLGSVQIIPQDHAVFVNWDQIKIDNHI